MLQTAVGTDPRTPNRRAAYTTGTKNRDVGIRYSSSGNGTWATVSRIVWMAAIRKTSACTAQNARRRIGGGATWTDRIVRADRAVRLGSELAFIQPRFRVEVDPASGCRVNDRLGARRHA